MAIKDFDWNAHKAHRDQVIKSQGVWIGLLDEDGYPLYDLPHPESYNAPDTKNVITNCDVVVQAQSSTGHYIPAVAELIADNLGKIDDDGLLVPAISKTRYLCIERDGGVRQTYFITHCIAQGTNSKAPTQLNIRGVSLLSIIDGIPAFSDPQSIMKNNFFQIQRDWVGAENTVVVFDEPIKLMDIKMVQVADGVTLEGNADQVIKRLVDRSLECVWKIKDIHYDYPIITSDLTGKPSPHTMIRPTDNSLLETIAEVALSAGISLSTRMIFPGEHKAVKNEPTILFNIEQE